MINLLVLVVDNLEQFPDILKAWEQIGVPGITVLDSIGSRRLNGTRDDLPLMLSLRAVLESQELHNRTMFSVIDNPDILEQAIEAAKRIIGDFTEPHTGLLFVVPVERAWGILKVEPHPRE